MRRLSAGLVLVLVLAAWAGDGRGQTPTGGCPPLGLVGFATETLTIGATAIGFTVATMAAAKAASVGQIETASIRWWDDGTTPTATTGHKVDAGQLLCVYGSALGRWKAIAVTATSATAPVSFYK